MSRQNTQKVRITDPGSTNGSFVDGQKIPEEGLTVSESTTIHVGDCVLTLQPAPQEKAAPRPGSAPNVSASGTAPFNRPPRQGALSAPDKVEAPTRKNVSDPPKFNIAMAVGPIIMAAAMVAIMQEIRYALFAMLSPILSIGMWVEQKRRHAKDKVKERVRFEQEMEKFKERIALSNREEIERLHDLAPAPDAVQLRALLPAMTLWRRRSTSPDLLTFHVGTGHDSLGSWSLDEAVAILSLRFSIFLSTILCGMPRWLLTCVRAALSVLWVRVSSLLPWRVAWCCRRRPTRVLLI